MSFVTFADLGHVGNVMDADNSPLAIGYIAAFAQNRFQREINPRLFKYPQRFSDFLKNETPRVAAFSNYMWNEQLGLAFARAIKKHRPEVVTVFGGPNYPLDTTEQKQFLAERPEIDFYIDGEGEDAFAELLEALMNRNFDVERAKGDRMAIANLHYVHHDEIILNSLRARPLELDAHLPSPYLSGLMDEFFDERLTPLVQTSRGCPYSCTFCHDGISYMNKTRRFSRERVVAEFEYIARRVKTYALTLADLNWGMFPEDTDAAHDLARLRKERNWPHFVSTATAKNQKTRVIEIAKILGPAMSLGASIQSTDKDVLKNIKRSNIAVDAIVTMAKSAASTDSGTYTEIILCLPGDTLEKHFKSVFEMLDAGIQDVLSYQFILLPGTEGASRAVRERFGYQTRFRVLPRSFGKYEIFDEPSSVAEMHEVCVANSTMPYDDYVKCRQLNLTLAVFNNGKIFEEIFNLASFHGIKRSTMVNRIHHLATAADSPLGEVYRQYIEDEEKNFWPTMDSLRSFVHGENGIERYRSGEFGANQIYKFRTLVVLNQFADTLDIALEALRAEMSERSILDGAIDRFLKELRNVQVVCKSELSNINQVEQLEVSFDFMSLKAARFHDDPRNHISDQPIRLNALHGDEKRAMLKRYFDKYGDSAEGLAHFIHRNRLSVHELYRDIQPAIIN